MDTTPIAFEIVKDQKEILQVTAYNTLTPGSVELIKIDKDDPGLRLPGAEFELQDKDGNTLQAEMTTDKKGQIVVNNLKPGHYQFVETKAPEGYEKLMEPVKFTIEKSQKDSLLLEITNSKIPVESKDPDGSRNSNPPGQPSKPNDTIKPNEPDQLIQKPGKSKDGMKLPNTATTIFNIGLVGLLLLLAGLLLARMKRKRQA